MPGKRPVPRLRSLARAANRDQVTRAEDDAAGKVPRQLPIPILDALDRYHGRKADASASFIRAHNCLRPQASARLEGRSWSRVADWQHRGSAENDGEHRPQSLVQADEFCERGGVWQVDSQ